MSEFKSVPVEPTAEGAGDDRQNVLLVLMSEDSASDLAGIVHSDPTTACTSASRLTTRILSALRARITPPAPDKLALAVEALELLNDCIWFDPDTLDYRVEHDGSVEKARAIIAAIKAST